MQKFINVNKGFKQIIYKNELIEYTKLLSKNKKHNIYPY